MSPTWGRRIIKKTWSIHCVLCLHVFMLLTRNMIWLIKCKDDIDSAKDVPQNPLVLTKVLYTQTCIAAIFSNIMWLDAHAIKTNECKKGMRRLPRFIHNCTCIKCNTRLIIIKTINGQNIRRNAIFDTTLWRQHVQHTCQLIYRCQV